MNIRLMLSDMDGTLIGADNHRSPRTWSAVRAAQQAGIYFTLAPGRMHGAVIPFLKALNIHGPVICFQGGVLADADTGRVLAQFPIKMETAREVLRYADELGVYSQYYTPDAYYIREHCDYSEAYKRSCFVEGIATGRPQHESLCFDPAKILLMDTPARIRELREKFRSRWGDRLQIDISKPHYLEITDRLANKGQALRQMAAEMGLTLDQVMCFGDALNDVPMLQCAGVGVAMANASEEAKAAAAYLAPLQQEDGVAQVIEAVLADKEGPWQR